MLNTTEEAQISRLRRINTEMITGTIAVLSRKLTSDVKQASSTAADSIIKLTETIPTDELQEIDKILEHKHEIHLADLLAHARKILASTPSAVSSLEDGSSV